LIAKLVPNKTLLGAAAIKQQNLKLIRDFVPKHSLVKRT
jgi:hypothetical protein